MQHIAAPRKRYARHFKLPAGLAVCLLLGIAACASEGPAVDTATHDRETEAAVLLKINTTIGPAPCSSDTQCRTIGLGANACGGPAAWRPWSSQTNGKGESLQILAQRLSELQRSRQTHDGMVSTCRYLPDPGALCQAQRCVLKTVPDSAS